MNRSLSVSSSSTGVSTDIGSAFSCSTRTRSRSLNDLPGGLRVPVLKRPERLKPRIQATLAGLEELRLLKEQQRNLVDEAKLGLKTRLQGNSDMKDLVFKQTYEWLSNCQDRLSVSNLEMICEESGKEEKTNAASFERLRKSADSNMAPYFRPQIKRPFSVSGYPATEQSRRFSEFGSDFKPSRHVVMAPTTTTTTGRSDKSKNAEKLTTMRRASFQCHVVLTKQKDPVPHFTASHEYPSPMHAVMRQYQPKIGDDKKRGDKERSRKSGAEDKSSEAPRSPRPREGKNGTSVIRRSSFTARPRRTDNNDSPPRTTSFRSRRLPDQEDSALYNRTDIKTRPVDDKLKARTPQSNDIRRKDSVPIKEPHNSQNPSVLRHESLNCKHYANLETKHTTEASQVSSSSLIKDSDENASSISKLRQNTFDPKQELLPKNSNSAKIISEYQNLKDLEQDRYCNPEPTQHNHPKVPDRIPTQLNPIEKTKNLSHSRGDSCSFTSDEGYCASLSSLLSSRRQLSIQSDASWISADIGDSRSCDLNVAHFDSDSINNVAPDTHAQKVDRKPSLSRCKNTIMATQSEALHAPKVLPFRQTSL